ncbi:MAG: hypothetical protein PVF68_10685 [Acidobacteriota bacterium]|jgi:hypothetical protein
MTDLSCDTARDLLAREAGEGITAAEFARLDAHREACAACAAALRGEDPLALFAALRDRRPVPGLWLGFWDGIRTAIADQAPVRGNAPVRGVRRPALAVAAAAAWVLLLGAGAWLGMREIAAPSPSVPAVVRLEAAPTVATVESIGSASARIYDMRVIDEDNRVTELVMIFDEGIDL